MKNKEIYYEVWYEPSTKEYFYYLKNNKEIDYAEIQLEGTNVLINKEGLVTYAEIDEYIIKKTVFNIKIDKEKVNNIKGIRIYLTIKENQITFTKKEIRRSK